MYLHCANTFSAYVWFLCVSCVSNLLLIGLWPHGGNVQQNCAPYRRSLLVRDDTFPTNNRTWILLIRHCCILISYWGIMFSGETFSLLIKVSIVLLEADSDCCHTFIRRIYGMSLPFPRSLRKEIGLWRNGCVCVFTKLFKMMLAITVLCDTVYFDSSLTSFPVSLRNKVYQ